MKTNINTLDSSLQGQREPAPEQDRFSEWSFSSQPGSRDDGGVNNPGPEILVFEIAIDIVPKKIDNTLSHRLMNHQAAQWAESGLA
jgi:hypothetical protein